MHDFNGLGPVEPERLFSVATYNVHGWIGMDGLYDPERVTGVVRELDADIIGLQEVAFLMGKRKDSVEDYLFRTTGLQTVLGPTCFHKGESYGNLLLTGHPVLCVRHHDLSVRACEPRGALDVDVSLNGIAVRVVVTHLGLGTFERCYQIRKLLKILSKGPAEFVIFMGDINEWLPVTPSLRKLCACLGYSPAPRTFPSRFPLLALDRIWVRPANALVDVRVHKTPVSRIASDHLPLKASIGPWL